MDPVEPPRPANALPDAASTREPFSPRDSKPSPQPDSSCTPAAMKELLNSDRVNYLIWRYLLEGSTYSISHQGLCVRSETVPCPTRL
ncbi:hypothetical protein VUR80DRAFT_4408 [Thermomyces stellatus]